MIPILLFLGFYVYIQPLSFAKDRSFVKAFIWSLHWHFISLSVAQLNYVQKCVNVNKTTKHAQYRQYFGTNNTEWLRPQVTTVKVMKLIKVLE